MSVLAAVPRRGYCRHMEKLAPEARHAITLDSWRDHPHTRWSFQNVAEFVPTTAIGNAARIEPGPADAAPLGDLSVTYPDGSRLSAADHFARSHADAVVVLKGERALARWHAAHCDPARPHILFSISKSITGMLAGIAVSEGLLDPEAPVTDLVDAQPGSAYAQARVRHLLDMTVALEFEEDYLDRGGPFDRYRRAMLWNPERADSAPEMMRQVLVTLPRASHPHGARFHYASPNTDMLGLVLEAATGRRFADYLTDRIWNPMGGGAAYVTVDREGSARAAGGICATVDDLARFAAMIRDRGMAGGRRIVPENWIDDMRKGGDRQAWLAGDFGELFPRGSYRSCWYKPGDDRGTFCGIGIHSQWVWVDPISDVVIARTGSRPLPSDDPDTHREASVLAQVARAF